MTEKILVAVSEPAPPRRPWDNGAVATRIVDQGKGVNRVVYDASMDGSCGLVSRF